MLKAAAAPAAKALATAGVVAATAPAAPMLAVLYALFPPLIWGAVSVAVGWRRRSAERFWKGLTSGNGDQTPSEIQGLLESHRDEPWVHEVVMEAVRRLLDSVTEEVADVLGSLSAEYIRDHRPPDAFFRGAARMLADLSREELEDLRELVHDLDSLKQQAVTVARIHNEGTYRLRVLEYFVEAADDSSRDGVFRGATLEMPRGSDAARHEFTAPTNYLRIGYLLKLHGLARDTPAGVFDLPSGPDVLVIEGDALTRLAAHLGRPTP